MEIRDLDFVVADRHFPRHPGDVVKLRATVDSHGRALCKKVGFLTQAFERCAVLIEHRSLLIEILLVRHMLGVKTLQETLCLELFPDKTLGKIIFFRFETKIELRIDLSERAFQFALTPG